MIYDFNLTVWQTNECLRCGGCCYAASINDDILNKKRNCLCSDLAVNIVDKDSSCLRQHDKPFSCREYSCKNEGLSGRIAIARAVNLLGTKPVENYLEITELLENYSWLD